MSYGSQKRHPRTRLGLTAPGSRWSALPMSTPSPCAATDPEQSGLARTGRSDHGRDLSGPDKKRHPGEGRRLNARVPMGDLVEEEIHHANSLASLLTPVIAAIAVYIAGSSRGYRRIHKLVARAGRIRTALHVIVGCLTLDPSPSAHTRIGPHSFASASM